MTDPNWLEQQIRRLEWHYKTHILKPAKALAEDFQNEGPLHYSGFFVLAGLMSYFEGIGQHLLGKDKKKCFQATFTDVYGCQQWEEDCSTVGLRFQDWVRHGLVHDAAVRQQTEMSRHFTVGIRPVAGRLEVNPYYLVKELESHLEDYICRLRDTTMTVYDPLRANFAKRRKTFEVEFGEPPGTPTTGTASPENPHYPFGQY